MRWRALVAAAGLVAAGAPASSGQEPVFRSAVDAVLVDVQVVDATGRPASGLTPAAFNVTIDGRRRRVLSADFMRYSTQPGATVAGAAGGTARNVWPAGAVTAGRTFVLAIDAGSLSMSLGALVVRSARDFVDRLGPSDAVGLVTLPRGPSLRPTADRQAFREALGRVAGLEGLQPNPFHLSKSEVIDISAEIDQMAASAMTSVTARGRSQMATVQDVLRQVQTRECRGTVDQVCLQEIAIDAESQARLLDERVTDTLSGFKGLLALLGEYPGRKAVVVLSAGMPVNDRAGGWHRDGSDARAIGRAAAQANASLYAVHIDTGYGAVYSAEQRLNRPAVSLARERDLAQRLLADLADASGGRLFEAPTDVGAQALSRILEETSAFYALGIAPDARDLDGRVHELRVSVTSSSTPPLTVRARRWVLLRKL